MEARPFPRDATFDGSGNATRAELCLLVELCLLDADGNEARVELPEYTDEAWHGYLPDVKPCQLCGYGQIIENPLWSSARLRRAIWREAQADNRGVIHGCAYIWHSDMSA